MGFEPGDGIIHREKDKNLRGKIYAETDVDGAVLEEVGFSFPLQPEVVGRNVIIRHEAGPLRNDLQRCQRCKAVLVNRREPMLWSNRPNGEPYPEGFVYQGHYVLATLRKAPDPKQYDVRICPSRTIVFGYR